MTTSARVAALVVDVSLDGVRIPLARARVAEVARAVLQGEGVRDAMLSITFVTRSRIASLNRKHLGHRGATDVISFGFRRSVDTDPVVGDVYICPEVASATARSLRVPAREELVRLIVHGTLHVLGHEHPEDEEREQSPMWAKQEGLVRRLAATTRRRSRTATRASKAGTKVASRKRSSARKSTRGAAGRKAARRTR